MYICVYIELGQYCALRIVCERNSVYLCIQASD